MNTQASILALMQAKGIGQRTLWRLLERLRAEHRSISDFVEAPLSELTGPYGLKSESAESISASFSEAEALADELERHNVHTLIVGSDTYPSSLQSSLGKVTPPVLFAAGELSILKQRGVGFCGSRKASERSCRIVSACANTLARRGFNVVSGYADGIDLAAHFGALQAGGLTTFVMATGILHFSPKKAISELIRDDNFLALSEFPPRLGWSVQNAMQRNRTIIGLTQAMILAEAGSQGGTFEAGKAALEFQRPLYVIESLNPTHTSEGDRMFLQRGACPLKVDSEGMPSLDAIVARLEKPLLTSGQISLF